MKMSRILTAVAVLGAAAAGLVGLMGTAVAGDNTCDLVHGQIQACKDAHGHWSSSCCCCIFH